MTEAEHRAWMNSPEYREWWQLHRRAAVGEELSDEERRAYEAVLARLHAEESIAGDLAALRDLRGRISEREAEITSLRARSDELRRQIADTERRLDERTRRELNIPPATVG